jgi:hypothetical protein
MDCHRTEQLALAQRRKDALEGDDPGHVDLPSDPVLEFHAQSVITNSLDPDDILSMTLLQRCNPVQRCVAARKLPIGLEFVPVLAAHSTTRPRTRGDSEP